MNNETNYQKQYLEAVKVDYNNILYVPTYEVTSEILQIVLSEGSDTKDFELILKIYKILEHNIDHVYRYERDEKYKCEHNIDVPASEDDKLMVNTLYCAIELLSKHLYYLLDNIYKIRRNNNDIDTIGIIIRYKLSRCNSITDTFEIVTNINKKYDGMIYPSNKSLDDIHGKYLFFIRKYIYKNLDFTDYRECFDSTFMEYIEEDKKYKQQLDEYVHKDDDEYI